TPGAAQEILDGDMAKTVRERWEKAKARAPKDTVPTGWDTNEKAGFLVFNEKHPAMSTGDTFKLSTLQQTQQELTDLYGDQGYAFANVFPDVQPDEKAKVVDITFQISRGEKVKVDRINITGNDPTYDKVVRREITINEQET